MFFAKNLKLLRTRKGKSQTTVADELGVKRTSLIGYERGVQPPFPLLMRMSDYFGVSVDAMLRYDLSKLGGYELARIEQGFEIDITGSKLRLLVETADAQGKSNIEMVGQQAQAGYAAGYGDPEFIQSLPRFQLPFLSQNKTYRCFQIQGDSMPPVADGSWVTASYVQDWSKIKSGTPCIVVTQEDGVVFKIVYNRIEAEGLLLLVSANPMYEPYSILKEAIVEVWQFETYNGFEV